MSTAEETAKAAKHAFIASQLLEAKDRLFALKALREALALSKSEILKANAQDVEAAKFAVADGAMDHSLLKRLDLQSSAGKFDDMLAGVDAVAQLQDLNDSVQDAVQLDDGLSLYKVACPIGTLLVIFEARPEVIVNITALAIKSGNSAILKGGKESLKTQAVLKKVIRAALETTSVPSDFIQTVESRSEIAELLKQDHYIDLVIPRGSNALVRSIQQSSKIPVMGHADGLCSIYIDESASLDKAIPVIIDAKTSYTAACNAVETLLLHVTIVDQLWPTIAEALLKAKIVLKCDDSSRSAIPENVMQEHHELVTNATNADYDTEFLQLILAVKVVTSLEEAIQHINTHGSHHTDAIITEDPRSMRLFTKAVDSAGVYVNASTRFADGFRYGFGTEVGVSTGKTHARGPVGLEGLMIYKYLIKNSAKEGFITTDYGSTGKRQFKHEHLTDRSHPFK